MPLEVEPMSTPREKLFACTFTTRTRSISMTIRAWDERQAALIFRELLDDDGVSRRGSMAVVDPLHRPVHRLELHADLG